LHVRTSGHVELRQVPARVRRVNKLVAKSLGDYKDYIRLVFCQNVLQRGGFIVRIYKLIRCFKGGAKRT